ncbi:hypothetical protein [Rubellimicrobium arenae]|uniref:hypothetical protein n=1 Tax=Rubellimicrobium arenae TaxID=2817372 RepID=UPI001B314796|nr:hypothetical protein [Rubellimicrobium arenae]
MYSDGRELIVEFGKATPPYRSLTSLYAGIAGSRGDSIEHAIIMDTKDRERAAANLLQSAEHDPLAHDALLRIVADCAKYGRLVPEQMREWAFLALTGQLERPKQKGKYPFATIDRDRAISTLISEVVQWRGLKATSADEERGTSACHAVAEGLGLLRLQPDSYSAVKRVWTQRRRRRPNPSFLRHLGSSDG